jgi:hypothetical protein
MKNICKNILKIVFISFVVLLSSCEKDLYEDTLAQNKKNFKYGTLSFKQIQTQNPRVANTINKLLYDLNSNIESKTTSNLYGFEVDTTKITFIEKQNGFKSYAFEIEQQIGLNYFKNLVLTEKLNGNLEIKVVKFNLSKTYEQVKLEKSLNESTTSKEVSKYSIPSNTMNLYTCIEVGYYDEVSMCEGDDRGFWDCYDANGDEIMVQVFIILDQSCGWASGGDGDSDSDGDGGAPSEGNPTDGGGGVSDNDGEIFIPNLISDTEAQVQGSMPVGPAIAFFESKLNKDNELPIYNDYPVLREILAANNCNSNSQQFVLQWIYQILNGATPLNLEDFDEHITPINLPICINTILDDIKNLNSDKFSDVIKLFTQKNPIALNYNWLIRKGPLASNKPAETISGSTNGNILTTLNQVPLQLSSKLSVAKTLMHEAFHAYLVSVFENNNIDNNYALLIEKYAKLYEPVDENDLQHYLFIKLNIVDEIKKALKEYGISQGYDFSDEYYEDMAWSGLTETPAFDQLSPERQERIINRDAAEFNSQNYNGYSPQTPRACP